MRNILYYSKNHKKINGTLFYSFEYFVFCKDLGEEVIFHLYNVDFKTFDKIIKIFKEKYNFNEDYIKDIIPINSIKDLHTFKSTKTMILDVHSLERTYEFIKNDIICFSNIDNGKIRSKLKKITYFGSYPYQNYDVETVLKFNFKIFKKIDKKAEPNVFVSSILLNKDIEIPEELKSKKIIFKELSSHVDNLYEKFDTLLYVHNGLDTNNRMIPECFYYKKKIHLDCDGSIIDSINYSYKKITEMGLDSYRLQKDDPMLTAFLS